jgi:hypothetical protein
MRGRFLDGRLAVTALVLLAAVAAPLTAGATLWCGENGLVRFSFVEGDSLVTVLHTEEPEGGVTTLEIYCWLTDVAAVAQNGEAFLHVGGFELQLDSTGDSEVFILEQEVPSEVLNLGKEIGHIAVGMHPSQKIRDGQVMLVRWKLLFQGRPENIRIGLDRSGLMSCAELRGCAKSEPPMLYVGAESSRQVGVIVGGGYVPSWINPTGDPDQTPVRGKQSWQDVGVFKER